MLFISFDVVRVTECSDHRPEAYFYEIHPRAPCDNSGLCELQFVEIITT